MPTALKQVRPDANDLLGLQPDADDSFAVHEMLVQGLPAASLEHLASRLVLLRGQATLERAVGISARTVQRKRGQANAYLSPEQSGRTWVFASVLARAIKVMGSQEEAERWLQEPAMALDRRRPIDLLSTPAGVEKVETLLGRIEYGVYT